jgi:orotidine-5'-phosphate decarboxylase
MSGARERIAWAADLPLKDALAFYPRIEQYVGVVKVGLALFVEHGPAAVEAFLAKGAKVFLDLKLHDIPNTVELAASRAGALGASFLTVHASGGEAMLKAALMGVAAGAHGAGKPAPQVLVVTALTSLEDEEVAAMGIGASAAGMAERLAKRAVGAGISGLVCSAREAGALRSAYPSVFLCTPGIRPKGAAQDDQARTETPAEAVKAGANLLVVGRPLHGATRPEEAALELFGEVSSALEG